MEGSPYRKSSISRKRGRSLGLVLGFLLAGSWSVPVSGTWESGTCLEAGGNYTGAFFPNRLHFIGLAILDSTQAGAHSEPGQGSVPPYLAGA
ncbi:hypothetical protein F2Q69_00020839 [Brassica cretica]|uniref:Uncharacterized protein n=1 Tax=Brassica cretica TaxID=69181 RepID=A0A8S9QKS9_BRACR|nr:hypothetical protein F2Q69_00020839 [Brassica cretica]